MSLTAEHVTDTLSGSRPLTSTVVQLLHYERNIVKAPRSRPTKLQQQDGFRAKMSLPVTTANNYCAIIRPPDDSRKTLCFTGMLYFFNQCSNPQVRLADPGQKDIRG